MPHGKSLKDGIESAMLDKLGIMLSPTFMTNILVKIRHDGTLISHMNALVYKVEVSDVILPFVSRNGTAYLGTAKGLGSMKGLDILHRTIKNKSEPYEVELEY